MGITSILILLGHVAHWHYCQWTVVGTITFLVTRDYNLSERR